MCAAEFRMQDARMPFCPTVSVVDGRIGGSRSEVGRRKMRMSSGPDSAVNPQDTPEQTQGSQRAKETLSAERRSMEYTVRVLSDMMEGLLGGDDAASRIPSMLCKDPIRPRESFELRRSLFGAVSEQCRSAIRQAYERLWLTRIQSVCHPAPVAAYNATERWFRQQVLTDSIRRPGTTLALAWFLIAIHNWIWWRTRAAGKPDVRAASQKDGDDAAKLESRLQEDVDQFLVLLEESHCGACDLTAMHLMTMQLQRWLMPRTVGRVAIALGQERGTRAETPVAAAKGMPDHLVARWDRIRMIGPITRLLTAVLPQQPSVVIEKNLRWHWLDTLFGDPATGPLRQYLYSELGKWLSHPQASREHIDGILHVLEQLAEAMPKKPEVEDGWNAFLVQVLWTTLDNLHSENLPLLWERWAEEGDGRVPLARWCGRLACRAEQAARSTTGPRLPDWAWMWYDLAKATLGRWLVGRSEAISCLGLWLVGYTESGKTIPPLTLGRRACQHSLDEIIAHWLGVSRVATSPLHPQYDDAKVQEAFVTRLGKLVQQLSLIPAIAEWAAEEVLTEPAAETAPPAAPDEEDQDKDRDKAPAARSYRYTHE